MIYVAGRKHISTHLMQLSILAAVLGSQDGSTWGDFELDNV